MSSAVIYLVATSGHPNFGDEIIARSWLRYLAETRPTDEVWLDSPQPGLSQILFDGVHPRLRVTNTLWRLASDSSGAKPAEQEAKVKSSIRDLGSPHYDLGLLKLREAESLHLLGGGYVNDIWPHHIGLIHAMTAVRKITGAKLYATGQGLMPTAVARSAAPEVFDSFQYAVARDQQSATTFELNLGLDDAFLDVQSELAVDRSEADGLMVCIQADMTDEHHFESAVAFARDSVSRAVAAGREVRYIEAIPGDDRQAYERMKDLIPSENFLSFAHIWKHGVPLSKSQEWITSRFHFHLLAAAAGASGVALGMKPGYYDVKHQSLIDIGSGWTFRESGSGAVVAGRGDLPTRLTGIMHRKKAEADSLYLPETSTKSMVSTDAVRRPLAAIRRVASRFAR